jgi:spermidine/putrescine transport system substrate-binding protein
MKKLLIILINICLFIGCSNNKQTLYVYNWSDYIDPELIVKFETENNCKVIIDQFDDNETMLAKMLAGADGYDIIFPSTYIIETFKKNDLIQKINLCYLTNVVKNIDKKYNRLMYDNSLTWSIPYAFSMTGIAYRHDKIKCDNTNSNSWNILFDSSADGRICILNDIREIIGIGLKYNGFSANSTNDVELIKALDTAIKFKHCAKKLDNIQYKTGIASAEFYICMGYNSDILQLKDEMDSFPITFFIPKEGSTCCFDEICITKNAKNIDLAYKFIDFLYDAENAAQNSKYIYAVVPNKGIWKYLDNEYKTNPLFNIPKETLDKLEPIHDVGIDGFIKFNKIWDKFIAASKDNK